MQKKPTKRHASAEKWPFIEKESVQNDYEEEEEEPKKKRL